MYKSITLPDNISFGELALKWCGLFCELPSTGITFVRFETKIVNHFVEYVAITDEGHVGQGIIADYYPSDRKILIRDEEKFQFILDFIEKRNNTITLPDHISLEELAERWCEEDDNNAIKNICGKWELVYFYEDCGIGGEPVFIFDPKSRELEHPYGNCHDKKQHILDFIKGRSHG